MAEGLIGLDPVTIIMNNGPARCDELDGRAVVRTVLDRWPEYEGGTDWDSLIGALAEHRRRYLIYHLAEQPSASVEELAESVVALEEEVMGGADPDAGPEGILVTLVHRHVPVLEAAGVVTLDEDAQVVTRGEQFSAALDLLDGAFTQPPERET